MQVMEVSLISTLDLWSDRQVLRHPSYQGPSPLIAQFALGRVVVASNFFQLRIMEAALLSVTLKAAELFFFVAFLRILSLRSAGSSFDLMAGRKTDVCLSKSCPINRINHRWTQVKVEKHLKDHQEKQEAAELHIECRLMRGKLI